MVRATFKGKTIHLPDDYQHYVINMVDTTEVINNTVKVIEDERSGKQLGLYTRFDNLNRAAIKYFRFNQFNLFAGLSGSGKSYLLNMIEEDFCNKELNSLTNDIIILHFGYEMNPVDEIIRTTSGKTGLSYAHILSSEWNNDTKNYNVLSDKEFNNIKAQMDSLRNRPILFARHSGTLTQMYITVYELANKFYNSKIVVANDHTLLNRKTKEDKSEIDLLANGAKTFMKIRDDFGAMILALGQLNGDILKVERRTNRVLHYPVMTDLHGSNQVFHASDFVMVMHRPEILNIEEYGSEQLNTKGLVHGAVLKNRRNTSGNVWFKTDFEHGRILAADKKNFLINFSM